MLTAVHQGQHFSLIQPEDLLLVDHTGSIQDESGPLRLLNAAAFMIHSAIHTARADVLCAAHSHSIHGRAFSTLGRELDMLTQDSCAFYKDHSVYSQFNGVVLDEEEGAHIVQALGGRKVRFQCLSARKLGHALTTGTARLLSCRTTACWSRPTLSRPLCTTSLRSRSPARCSSWQRPLLQAVVSFRLRSAIRRLKTRTRPSAPFVAAGSARNPSSKCSSTEKA